jgi:hypothetical protein
MTIEQIESRLAELRPVTVMGPAYQRGAVECMTGCRRAMHKGELESAARWLARAEQEAGVITMDELARLLSA